MAVRVRRAVAADAEATAGLYGEAIASGRATLRWRAPEPREMHERISDPDARHPVVVAELDGEVVACAWIDPYSPAEWYADVGEFSVYVAPDVQRLGIGTILVGALLEAAHQGGLRKVTAKVLADNEASRRMCAQLGFREVGVHRRHGRIDGRWQDVVILERFLEERPTST
jgi:phosphinothricin acetyltransferase